MVEVAEKTNVIEERTEFYISYILEDFKIQNIAESSETLIKILEGKKKKLENENFIYIRSEFIRKSLKPLDRLILTNGLEYNSGKGGGRIYAFFLNYSNFDKYYYKNDITLEDAAAIYIETEPSIITASFINENKHLLIDLAVIKEYFYVLEVLKEGLKAGLINEENDILTYRNYLLDRKIACSEIEHYLDSGNLISNTAMADIAMEAKGFGKIEEKEEKSPKPSKITEKEPPIKKQQESTRQKKLNNVLKLFYYMAEDKYNHSQGEEANTAKKLASLSGHSDQTIKKWLEDAAFLIQDDK